MNDLDRQVAEAAGWTYSEDGHWGREPKQMLYDLPFSTDLNLIWAEMEKVCHTFILGTEIGGCWAKGWPDYTPTGMVEGQPSPAEALCLLYLKIAGKSNA